MSTFAPMTLECPHCGRSSEAEIARSVHAGRAPQHRAAILDGSFQRFTCDGCGECFEIDEPFIYIDPDRRDWIGVFPRAEEADWRELEEAPLRAHALACGPAAPSLARELGAQMRVRAVFGLAALREKLVCAAAGLDDVALERAKLRWLADAALVVSAEQPLRLFAVDAAAQTLLFSAPDGAGGCTQLSLARSRFDEMAAAATGHADDPARALGERPFVDLRRLLW